MSSFSQQGYCGYCGALRGKGNNCGICGGLYTYVDVTQSPITPTILPNISQEMLTKTVRVAQDEITPLEKGDELVSLGRYEDALQAYDEALRMNVEDSIALSSKAVVLTSLKQYKELVTTYDLILRNKLILHQSRGRPTEFQNLHNSKLLFTTLTFIRLSLQNKAHLGD